MAVLGDSAIYIELRNHMLYNKYAGSKPPSNKFTKNNRKEAIDMDKEEREKKNKGEDRARGLCRDDAVTGRQAKHMGVPDTAKGI